MARGKRAEALTEIGQPLSAVSLAEVKDYLRVEGDVDDVLIGTLKTAAEDYLLGAGVTAPGEGSRRALYVLAVCALCLTWYEQRDLVMTGSSVATNPMLRQIITQLKLTEPPAVRGEAEP